MAVRKNLVTPPPLNAPIVDAGGRLSQSWSVWFRDLYARTSDKKTNAIDENEKQIEGNIEATIAVQQAVDLVGSTLSEVAIQVAENILAINDSNLAILSNAESISTNSLAISESTQIVTAHVAAEAAHGSNGNVIGANDLATETVGGLVKKLSLVTAATDSTVDISLADLLDAPLSYDPTSQQLLINLCNEQKTAINQLKADLNAVNSVLSSVISKAKDAGLMS